MLEDTLNRMAEKILHMDEASLANLLDKYRQRVENVEISQEWERAVIVFFLINAVKAKNQKLNEHILKMQNTSPTPPIKPPKSKPALRLVKSDS